MNKKTKDNAKIIAEAFGRLNKVRAQLPDSIDFAKMAREFPYVPHPNPAPHEAHYDALVEYLRQKTIARDWHAVSDAANDIRALVAQHPDLEQPIVNIGIPCNTPS